MDNTAILVLDVFIMAGGAIMILSRHFEDGIIGKIAIAAMVIASFAHFANAMDEWDDQLSPSSIVLRYGLALMFTWRAVQVIACWLKKSRRSSDVMKG